MTWDGAFPERVSALVEARLDSIEMIQVLMVLHGEPTRSWSAEEVARATGLDPVSASGHLIVLRQRGFLLVTMAGDASYTYGARGELSDTVDALMECYRTRPLELANLVAARPRNKLRLFADAFRVRRDK